MTPLHFYLRFAEIHLFLMLSTVLLCVFFFFHSLFCSSSVDCFISNGHNSGEEGLCKSINTAVEQSPGEEWTYGM